MGIIRIEISGDTNCTYHVDSGDSTDFVLKEVGRLLKEAGNRPAKVPKSGSKALERARHHLKSLENKEASLEATRIAKEMRKSWIRENV